MSTTGPRHTYDDEQGSTAYGIAVFAGVLLATLGCFQILQGLSAVLKDDVYVTGIDYVYKIDLTTWGWIAMLLGAIGIAIGVGIIKSQVWASGRGNRFRGALGPGPIRVHALLPLLGDG